MVEVTTLLTCMEASQSPKTGLFSIKDIWNELYSNSFPIQIPPFIVFVTMEFGVEDFGKDLRITCLLVNLDGAEKILFEAITKLGTNNEQTRLETSFFRKTEPFAIMWPGEFTIRLKVNGESISTERRVTFRSDDGGSSESWKHGGTKS